MQANYLPARQRLPFKLSSVAMLAIAACGGAASAADTDFMSYHLNGFATVGVVHSNEKHGDVTSTGLKPNGAGFTREWSTDPDTRLGAQLDLNVGQKWTATVQLVSEQNFDNTYTPTFEWANVKYAVTPDFSVRVGRVALPTYMFSDSRKVGYSMASVRSPIYFYDMLPFRNNDGIDVSYRFRSGGFTNTTIAMYGGYNLHQPTPKGEEQMGLVEMRKSFGLTNRTEYGNLLAQVSYYKTRATVPAFADFPDLAPIFTDSLYKIITVGFNYDPGQWFLLGEWDQDKAEWQGTRRGGYISAGYRIGQFTPYYTFEAARLKGSIPGRETFEFDSHSAGLRWDFMRNADIKLQYDYNKPAEMSNGVLFNVQPGRIRGKTFGVVSLAADFVF